MGDGGSARERSRGIRGKSIEGKDKERGRDEGMRGGRKGGRTRGVQKGQWERESEIEEKRETGELGRGKQKQGRVEIGDE